MSKKDIILPAAGDITLDDEIVHYGQVKEKNSWHENHYHLVMGEVDDYDFFLMTSVIVLRGLPGGYNMIEDGVSHYTTFFMLPQKQRGRMADNDFIHASCVPHEHLKGNELGITRKHFGTYCW